MVAVEYAGILDNADYGMNYTECVQRHNDRTVQYDRQDRLFYN